MTAACGNPSWNASEFEKAVGLALSKLNVGGICSLTVHQSRSADCFLSGNREFKIRSLRTTDYGLRLGMRVQATRGLGQLR